MKSLKKTYQATSFPKIDTRVKLLISISFLILLGLSDDIYSILYVFLLTFVFSSLLIGNQKTIRQIWAYKYLILLVIAINYILTQEINFRQILAIVVSIVTLLMSFNALNQTTNPDEITDSLLKLRVPSAFAWNIGITLRQVDFILDEISNLRRIHRNRYLEADRSIKQRLRRLSLSIAMLMSNTLSRAIIRAQDISETLYVRGFEGAHREIILNENNISKTDYFIIFLFVLLLFPFLIIRSQVFMSLFQ